MPAPPPVVAPAAGLPSSLCDGLPQVVEGATRYCVLGLRVTGDAAALEAARASLAGEGGWNATLVQPAAGPPVLTVDAKGANLTALLRTDARLRSAAAGSLTVSTIAIPMPR